MRYFKAGRTSDTFLEFVNRSPPDRWENGVKTVNIDDQNGSAVLQRPQPRAARSIVFVNRFFYPDESATSQMLTDLAVDLAKKGHAVRVVTSRLHSGEKRLLPRNEIIQGVEVFRVASRAQLRSGRRWKLFAYLSFYPRAFVALMRVVRKGDLVVAKTDPPLIAIIAMIVAFFRAAGLVTWLQDLYPEVAIELKAPLVSGRFGAFLVNRRNTALRFAKANVVIGDLMAKNLERGGIPARNIYVVHNWADDQAIQPINSGQSEMRKRWGLDRNTFVVGYSGNLGRAHEIETVLEASVILRDSDVRFLFVGSGHGNELLRAAVLKRGLTNFIFEPHQPREALSDVLGAADAHWLSLRPELEGLIVPSKFYGILASGRPVLAVTSQGGQIASEVRKHNCGFVIAPGDHKELVCVIERLVSERDLCTRTGEAARHATDTRFSKGGALRAWSNVIDSIGQLPGPAQAKLRFVKAKSNPQIPDSAIMSARAVPSPLASQSATSSQRIMSKRETVFRSHEVPHAEAPN